MPPVHTVFVTGSLERAPTPADQAMLASALARLEAAYPFGAADLLTFVSYGIPYFRRLPGGPGRPPRVLPHAPAAAGPPPVRPGRGEHRVPPT